MKFIWVETQKPYIGVDWRFDGENAYLAKVILDQPGCKAGLNAGDEVIAINGLRFSKTEAMNLENFLVPGTVYKFTISRLEKLFEINVSVEKEPRRLKQIEIFDKDKANHCFGI